MCLAGAQTPLRLHWSAWSHLYWACTPRNTSYRGLTRCLRGLSRVHFACQACGLHRTIKDLTAEFIGCSISVSLSFVFKILGTSVIVRVLYESIWGEKHSIYWVLPILVISVTESVPFTKLAFAVGPGLTCPRASLMIASSQSNYDFIWNQHLFCLYWSDMLPSWHLDQVFI